MTEGAVQSSHGLDCDVSVVVSTYSHERWAELQDCLESLRRLSPPPREVIVVVDHNDELLELATETFGGWATVIGNTHRRGLAGARNCGVAIAGAPIVAFIDDDATADPGWVGELAACFDDRDTVGVGGSLIPRWQTAEPAWMPSEFLWVVGCSYTGLPETVAPVRNPIGANMSVRVAALDAVGGFREGDDDDQPRELRSRGVVRAAGNVPDDTDLAIRVSQAVPGAIWLYQPAASVHHLVTGERATLRYFLRRTFEEGVGKASLARLVGSAPGLQSERAYAARVLPRGILRGLRGLLTGDGAAGLRALAIAVGGLTTAAGFAYTTVRSRLGGG